MVRWVTFPLPAAPSSYKTSLFQDPSPNNSPALQNLCLYNCVTMDFFISTKAPGSPCLKVILLIGFAFFFSGIHPNHYQLSSWSHCPRLPLSSNCPQVQYSPATVIYKSVNIYYHPDLRYGPYCQEQKSLLFLHSKSTKHTGELGISHLLKFIHKDAYKHLLSTKESNVSCTINTDILKLGCVVPKGA